MSAFSEFYRKCQTSQAGPGRQVIAYSYKSLGPPLFLPVFN